MNEQELSIHEKHPLVIRWLHWLNFPFLTLMIWSGILIYWADPAFIPLSEKWAKKLKISYRLAEGMGWHFLLMWFFAINGVIYVLYLWLSGQWREIVPDKHTLPDLLPTILHDLKLKAMPPPVRGKYNAAQKLAYTGVILMGAGSLITGMAIYKPVQVGWLTEMLGGYRAARFEHFLLMVGFILFFIIHIIQVLRAGWNNLRSMLAGYSIEK